MLESLPERLDEMEPSEITSDVLLGPRLAASTTPSSSTPCETRESPKGTAPMSPQMLPSLTVTPDQAQDMFSGADCSTYDAPEGVQKALERRRDEKQEDDKGLRGKFVRFLQREASKKRNSLSEIQRLSMCESDSDLQEKLWSTSDRIADEIDQLEELLNMNREALIEEHLERLHDRASMTLLSSASAASNDAVAPPSVLSAYPSGTPSSPPPIHWRSRAPVRRNASHPTRRTDGCTSSGLNATDIKLNGADSKTSMAILPACRTSSSQLYCDKVYRGIAPVINPIDKALGKISNFVHGPIPSQNRHASAPPPPWRPAPSAVPEPQKTPAQLRKEIARGFWTYIMCGSCVDGVNQNGPIPRERPTSEETERQEQAIREMEKRIEADVQARLARFKQHFGAIEAASSNLSVANAAAELEDANQAVVPSRDKAAVGVETEHIAESVVELHQCKGDMHKADRGTARVMRTSIADTRRALFISLGTETPCNSSTPTAAEPTHATMAAPLCRPLPDPSPPITPMLNGEVLSPVSYFFAQMATQHPVPSAPKPAATETTRKSSCCCAADDKQEYRGGSNISSSRAGSATITIMV